MDYRDVIYLDNCDLYELSPGDLFVEDCYPDVYRVSKVKQVEGIPLVFADNLTRNVSTAFSYTEPAYAPKVIRVKQKERGQ